MLNVYIGKNALPPSPIFVPGIEEVIPLLDLCADKITRNILLTVDSVEPVGHDIFKDRFGSNLHIEELSTSCKILLAAHQLDMLINCDQLEDHAYAYLCRMSKGNVCFPTVSRYFVFIKTPVFINNKLCNSRHDILNAKW